MAKQIVDTNSYLGLTTRIFHEGALISAIEVALSRFDQVVVCWQESVPIEASVAHELIEIEPRK